METKINNSANNWKMGRELTAYVCISGDSKEIVYALNSWEASKFFSSQYPKNLVISSIKEASQDEVNLLKKLN